MDTKPVKISFNSDVVKYKLSDITIYVANWVFPSYKFVLKAASPVFSAMLNGHYMETDKGITITDVSPQIFSKVLLYITEGNLEVRSLSETLSILTVADKYQIECLKLACEIQLDKYQICWDTFWDLLSNYIDGPFNHIVPWRLKLKFWVFFDKNALAIVTDRNFLFLSKELVMKIMLRDTLHITEKCVCLSLLNWAKMQCTRNRMEPTTENQRTILGNALYTMRLQRIPIGEVCQSSIFDFLNDIEKEIMMKDGDENLPDQWVWQWWLRGRDCRDLYQEGLDWIKHFTGPIYIVFAKNAFVHELEVDLPNDVKAITFYVLNERGVETFVTVGDVIDQTYAMFKSIYVKAFTCYKLEFEHFRPNEEHNLGHEQDRKHTVASSFGCEFERNDNPCAAALFYSIEIQSIDNYKTFLTSDYWIKAFTEHKFDLGNQGTCIYSVKATFCS